MSRDATGYGRGYAKGRDMAALGWSYLCLVRILFSRGEMAAAEEAIRSLEEVAGRSYVPPDRDQPAE